MADQIDLREPETVKQIVVVENQIRKPIELLEILGLFRACVRRRIHPAMCREVVEESVPLLSEGTMKINDGRALALDDHRIGREAARQLDILRCLDIHAVTFASPLLTFAADRASCG